jgi:pyoverdine/dityrosine biosynthesis protein Dit1
MQTSTNSLTEEIINYILIKRGDKDYHECTHQLCVTCANKIYLPIARAVEANEAVHFVLPAFPAKSANRNKTLSHLPDYGEILALHTLNELIEGINKLYQPGASLTICSDGRVFNDIVGVDDKSVTDYVKTLKNLVETLKVTTIDFFDLSNYWPDLNFKSMRKKLTDEFADSIDVLRAAIKENGNEKKLFNGLHRFLFEDFSYLEDSMSKNQVRIMAREKTYQTIQRSHAWSELIKKQFPSSIRLSIHPQTCDSEKLAFQLIRNSTRWATPWHNVTVNSQGKFLLMKHSDAKKLNVKLIHNHNTPSHYEVIG